MSGGSNDGTLRFGRLTVEISKPDKLLYDQVAGHGKTAHDVAVATDDQTQLVAYPMPPKKSRKFGPEVFTLSEDGLWLTCPHGRITNRRYRSGSGRGDTC